MNETNEQKIENGRGEESCRFNKEAARKKQGRVVFCTMAY